MNRRSERTWWAMGAGLVLAASVGTTASAAIPFEAEITPGQLRGIPWEPGDPWSAGYWEYLPQNYDEVPEDHLYPLLVTLGGIGTMDTPSTCPGGADWCTVADCEAAGPPDGICRGYRRGPGVEIRQGLWDDTERPFIVVTVQNAAETGSAINYDRDAIDALVTFVVDNYPVDPRRMYLLGNSQGGRGVMQYTALYSRRMAAVTIGPGGVVSDADAACRFQDTAFWAFHGEDDDDDNIGVGVFDPCLIVEQVRMYNQPEEYPELAGCVDRVDAPHPEARMTMFEDTAHNAWTPAFENVANGFFRSTWAEDQLCGYSTNFYAYDAALDADGVYTWMLTFDRPDTDAGPDFVVPGDRVEFSLVATTVDDDPIGYTWTQTGGPPVTLTDADQAEATVTDFEYEQVYTFEVRALDADQQWDVDEVIVTVEAEVDSASTGSEGTTSGASGSGSTSAGASSGSGADTTSAGGDSGSTSTAADGGGSTSGPPPITGADTSAGAGSTGAAGSSSGVDTAGADGEDGGAGCGCRSGASTGSGSGAGWLGLIGLIGLRRRARTVGRPRSGSSAARAAPGGRSGPAAR